MPAAKRSGGSAGAIILLYHRVAESELDPQLMSVTPEHFAEHLAVLGQDYDPIPLEALSGGDWPARPVAITFDDGYRDNLYEAKPLLVEAGIPATVFVSTGRTGTDEEFFWDELERVFLLPGRLPRVLSIDVDQKPREWDLGDAAEYTQADYERCRMWNVLQKEVPTQRQYAYRGLCQLVQCLHPVDRRAVLAEVRTWAGVDAAGRLSHRALAGEQLRELVEGDLIEVGGHTVGHPVLSRLSLEDQRVEIEGNKARLEEILGRSVTSFSFPFGHRGDYTVETTDLVRAAGYQSGCANVEGLVEAGTDRFERPRFLVRDCDRVAFDRQLRQWWSGDYAGAATE